MLRKLKAKMPSDPLEAEILALAGAIGGGDDDLESDDSLPEDNLDLDEDKPLAASRPNRPKFSEDIENIMSGSNIVPKALPAVTPDSMPQAQHQAYNHLAGANRNHHQRSAAVKRRHSGKEGN